MESLELESLSTDPLSFSHSRLTMADPHAEPDGVGERAPPTDNEAQSASAQSGDSIDGFTEDQIRAMQNDDAMAGAMVGIILTMAFVVLLFLTIGVNVWMQCFAR